MHAWQLCKLFFTLTSQCGRENIVRCSVASLRQRRCLLTSQHDREYYSSQCGRKNTKFIYLSVLTQDAVHWPPSVTEHNIDLLTGEYKILTYTSATERIYNYLPPNGQYMTSSVTERICNSVHWSLSRKCCPLTLKQVRIYNDLTW